MQCFHKAISGSCRVESHCRPLMECVCSFVLSEMALSMEVEVLYTEKPPLSSYKFQTVAPETFAPEERFFDHEIITPKVIPFVYSDQDTQEEEQDRQDLDYTSDFDKNPNSYSYKTFIDRKPNMCKSIIKKSHCILLRKCFFKVSTKVSLNCRGSCKDELLNYDNSCPKFEWDGYMLCNQNRRYCVAKDRYLVL